MTAPRRPRAIVVGATFGAVYAEALAAADSPVELVGLASTGSAASAALADHLGVALYPDLDDLPRMDVAFVVVRSGVVGRRRPDRRAVAHARYPRDAGAARTCG